MSAFWSVNILLALRRIIKHRQAQATANATVMPSSTGMNTERFFFRFLGGRAGVSFFWFIVCFTTFAGASSVIYL